MATRILRSSADRVLYPIHWKSAGGVPTSNEPEPAEACPAQAGQVPAAQHDQAAALRTQLEQQWHERLQLETDEARRAGEASGRQRTLAEVEELLMRLARSIESVAAHKPRLRQEAERDIVELSLSVAKRIMRRQLVVDEEAILGLVKAALDNTSLGEVTDIRVHPQFAERIAGHLRQLGSPQAIQVIPDAALEVGAVLVETSRGCLDASLETQLEEISLGFADLVEGGRCRL